MPATLPEIHLINLDRSIDRLTAFNARNAHLKDVVRFPAVDGSLINRDQLLKDGIMTEGLLYPPGTLGSALSHIALWKKTVSENRHLTIFEDDAVCSLNFTEETSRVLSLLPADWEIVLWGSNVDPAFAWIDLGYVKANMRFYGRRFKNDYDAFQRENFVPVPFKLLHAFGTHAYSISPAGARKLLDACLPLRERNIRFPGAGVVTRDTSIDITMCAAYGTMSAYLCLPLLAIQDKSLEPARISKD